jgi:ABC-type branched-chain amino acid transport systems, ATPase component
MLLDVQGLSKEFGGLRAVNEVRLEIAEKELVGLIGPNGAGKTTFFNLVTGVYEPTVGTIRFDGKEIQGKKPYVITQGGMSRTFQNIRLFSNLTVLENVKTACHFRVKYSALEGILRLGRFISEEKSIKEEAMSLLEIFGLAEKQDELARNLPYGEQRRLEIARALATHPKLLLLDEPAAGMNPQETAELTDLIQWIRDKFDLSILLIEHDMSLVMKLCERIYVLDYGSIIAQGTPEQIRENPKVIQAYLGEEG